MFVKVRTINEVTSICLLCHHNFTCFVIRECAKMKTACAIALFDIQFRIFDSIRVYLKSEHVVPHRCHLRNIYKFGHINS